MALSRWQATIVNDRGDVQPGASVSFYREVGGALQALKADIEGADTKANPFTADSEGYAFCYAPAGRYRIVATLGAFEREWRDVQLGTAQSVDFDALSGNVNNTLYFDIQVDELSDRDDYDDEDAGFVVLVSDVGDGRAAIYSRVGETPGVWSAPAYVSFGAFSIYHTIAAAEAEVIAAAIKVVETRGYTEGGDGGGARYNRVDSEPAHEGKFRSVDRYLSDGTISSGDGGWWELDWYQIVETKMFGAKCDDATDDSPAVNAFLDYMKAKGGFSRISKGVSLLTTARANVVAGTMPLTIGGYGRASAIKRNGNFEWTFFIHTTDGVTLENFLVDGNGINFPTNPGPVVRVVDCNDAYLNGLFIERPTTSGGIVCTGASPPPNQHSGVIVNNCKVNGNITCNNGILLVSLQNSGVQNCFVRDCQGNPGWAIELKSGGKGNWITNNNVTGSNRGIGTANDVDESPDFGPINARIENNTSYANVAANYHFGRLENSIFSGNISDCEEISGLTGVNFSTNCKNITGGGNLIRNVASGQAAIVFGGQTGNICIGTLLENVPAGCITAHNSALNHVVEVEQIINGPNPRLLWNDIALGTSRGCRIYLVGEGYNLGWFDIASAATVTLRDSPSEYVRLTGSTNVSSFGDAPAGTVRYVRPSSSFTLVNGTSLRLPNDADTPVDGRSFLIATVIDGSNTWAVSVNRRTMYPDVANQVITGGFQITGLSLGEITTGTLTLACGSRPMQRYTNGGAHTLAPGTGQGEFTLKITNNASAGAINTSGFTYVTGASFDTTNGSVFICRYYRDNTVSWLHREKVA